MPIKGGCVSQAILQQPASMDSAGGTSTQEVRASHPIRLLQWATAGNAWRVVALVLALGIASSFSNWVLRTQLGFSIDDVAGAIVTSQSQGEQAPELVRNLVRWT